MIVIADDDRMVQAAVQMILQEKAFQVVGEASDGEEAVRLCGDLEPDMFMLVLSMPRLNGIDAAREIKKGYPSTGIILFTVHTECSYILESLRAGVAGYVTKDQATSSLSEAINAVYKGEIYVRAGRI